MTPEDLRKLVEEATPGQPWKPTMKPIEPSITLDELRLLGRISFVDSDARLIALAPQLALLCAEMAEALEEAAAFVDQTWSQGGGDEWRALASLEALEKP